MKSPRLARVGDGEKRGRKNSTTVKCKKQQAKTNDDNKTLGYLHALVMFVCSRPRERENEEPEIETRMFNQLTSRDNVVDSGGGDGSGGGR